MKLLKYEKYERDMIVGIVFDDNTYNLVRIVDNTRPKQEILKDAYIILKNVDRLDYLDDINKLQDLELASPKTTFMDIDFYNLSGVVYDQYGEAMDKEISFVIEGTDKAKIVDGKLIEKEVEEEASFFIVAKCEDLEQKQERTLYPKAEDMEVETREQLLKRVILLEGALQDMILSEV